jgi:hypothetical protein
MDKKHEITENGELYLSDIALKKRHGVAKATVHQWARDGKVRMLARSLARMPHSLMNDNQLELHFYHAGDVQKVQAEAEAARRAEAEKAAAAKPAAKKPSPKKPKK